MKQTAWEQSDWTYFFLFLMYCAARGPETRFRVGWVPGRRRRARCARKVYMSYGRASWVNCGGFGATRSVSRGAWIRDCTMMGRRATLAAAVRSRGPYEAQKSELGW